MLGVFNVERCTVSQGGAFGRLQRMRNPGHPASARIANAGAQHRNRNDSRGFWHRSGRAVSARAGRAGGAAVYLSRRCARTVAGKGVARASATAKRRKPRYPRSTSAAASTRPAPGPQASIGRLAHRVRLSSRQVSGSRSPRPARSRDPLLRAGEGIADCPATRCRGSSAPGRARDLIGEAASYAAWTYRARRSFHLPQRHLVRIGPGTMRSPACGMAEASVSYRRLPTSLSRPASAMWACMAGSLDIGASNTFFRCRTQWSVTCSPPVARRPNSRMSAGRPGPSVHELHPSGGKQGGNAIQEQRLCYRTPASLLSLF